MIRFETFGELKDAYMSGKHDIYLGEPGRPVYKVAHLGSTIYCRDTERNMGMGSVTLYPIDMFYGEEKPVGEAAVDEDTKDNTDAM